MNDGSMGIQLKFKNSEKTMFSIPKEVGGYSLGNGTFKHIFYLPEKPSFIKRFLMKHLLGFKWVDA